MTLRFINCWKSPEDSGWAFNTLRFGCYRRMGFIIIFNLGISIEL